MKPEHSNRPTGERPLHVLHFFFRENFKTIKPKHQISYERERAIVYRYYNKLTIGDTNEKG